ncbi:MAG: cysteine desulfurase family protein [Gammaproteobacteria bacterium]|nr:cysteine desulfurase family protein [Gammaproteobacteria bacterium]
MSIYLDYNATTPLDERVLEVMLPYLREQFGNPSSGYRLGRTARAAMDTAREQVATLVNAHPSQVVFTSGGTEANNLAIKGLAGRVAPGHLAISAVEHDSVRAAAGLLQQQGWSLETVGVDAQGRLDLESMRAAIAGMPPGAARLVAVMLANNETGVIHDVASVSGQARESGAAVLVDAVQAIGKIPVDIAALGASLMSLSAHKIYGPKGAGALIVDKAMDMQPMLHGGGHEKGRRAGTENVAAIVGFGKAAELALAALETRTSQMRRLREHLEQRLLAEMPALCVFGQQAQRLPNTSFFALPGVDGETLLMSLDQAGLAVSSGSACSTGEVEPSHVLMAMGVDPALARGAIRVSMGKDTRRDEVDQFVDGFKQQLQTLQRFASVACA